MSLAQTYELVERALEGGQTAYGELLERLRPRLVVWCASRMSEALRARVEPDDVAQETLLAIHQGLSAFRGAGREAFFGWVFRIAENRIRDLVDYHGALKRRPAPPLSFTATTPSRGVARAEAAVRLERALAGLSDDHRLVIRLRRIEERSFAEVAEAMGRRPGAVRMLYTRAMGALADVMQRQGWEGAVLPTPRKGGS